MANHYHDEAGGPPVMSSCRRDFAGDDCGASTQIPIMEAVIYSSSRAAVVCTLQRLRKKDGRRSHLYSDHSGRLSLYMRILRFQNSRSRLCSWQQDSGWHLYRLCRKEAGKRTIAYIFDRVCLCGSFCRRNFCQERLSM